MPQRCDCLPFYLRLTVCHVRRCTSSGTVKVSFPY
jgi:hypothetical protein